MSRPPAEEEDPLSPEAVAKDTTDDNTAAAVPNQIIVAVITDTAEVLMAIGQQPHLLSSSSFECLFEIPPRTTRMLQDFPSPLPLFSHSCQFPLILPSFKPKCNFSL